MISSKSGISGKYSPAKPVLLLTVLLFASQPALADSAMPTANIRLYDPISRNTEYLEGDLYLSTTHARFSKRKGHLELEWAGKMPASRSNDHSEADVFRVKNWEEYLRLNDRTNGFCPSPKWLTLRELSWGTSGRPTVLRVCMFTVDDWRAYRPDQVGLCSCNTYGPRQQ